MEGPVESKNEAESERMRKRERESERLRASKRETERETDKTNRER